MLLVGFTIRVYMLLLYSIRIERAFVYTSPFIIEYHAALLVFLV